MGRLSEKRPEVVPQQIEPLVQVCAFESNTKFVGDIDTRASPDTGISYQASGLSHVRLDKVFYDVARAVAAILVVSIRPPIFIGAY
jgi:hypothetical protein